MSIVENIKNYQDPKTMKVVVFSRWQQFVDFMCQCHHYHKKDFGRIQALL